MAVAGGARSVSATPSCSAACLRASSRPPRLRLRGGWGLGWRSRGWRVSELPTISRDRTNFPPWGEKEISRFEFRVGLFKRRGWDQHKAETWADRLFERDFERDDRHCCIECKNLQRDRKCLAAKQGRLPSTSKFLEPIDDLLQRCECFEWVKP